MARFGGRGTGGNCEFSEDGERQREAKGYREREPDKEDVSRRQGTRAWGKGLEEERHEEAASSVFSVFLSKEVLRGKPFPSNFLLLQKFLL